MGDILPEPLEREVAAMTADQKRVLARMLTHMAAATPTDRKGGLAGGLRAHLWSQGQARDRAAQARPRRMALLRRADGGRAHPLGQLAERCGMCLRTSCFMRMRVCEAMSSHLDEFASGPGVAVEVDGTMLHESLVGNNGGASGWTTRFTSGSPTSRAPSTGSPLASWAGTWLTWLEQFRRGSADMREPVSREAFSGGYETMVRGIFAEPRFQMGALG